MGELLETYEELWIKWLDKIFTLIYWCFILAVLGWFAHQSYYDYLKAGLIKAGADKQIIEDILKH